MLIGFKPIIILKFYTSTSKTKRLFLNIQYFGIWLCIEKQKRCTFLTGCSFHSNKNCLLFVWNFLFFRWGESFRFRMTIVYYILWPYVYLYIQNIFLKLYKSILFYKFKRKLKLCLSFNGSFIKRLNDFSHTKPKIVWFTFENLNFVVYYNDINQIRWMTHSFI